MESDVKLESLTIRNYRCFENHVIYFSNDSIIVGKNNAGKSTVVESLRFISLVTERLLNLPAVKPPSGIGLGPRMKGFRPSLKSIVFQKEAMFHRYGDPPAEITAQFSNNSQIKVYLGRDSEFHAMVRNQSGKYISSRSACEKACIPVISILPQIYPVLEEEDLLEKDYVKSHLQTARSSRHFRNQLYYLNDHFEFFENLVKDSWPHLQISEFKYPKSKLDADRRLSLLIRDSSFTAELGWTGHGLQMWIQIMWFIARSKNSDVLILDEPDVYMHADLQRKLARMLLNDKRQTIVATHSPEILAEVDPSSIIVLDREKESSKSATSANHVQKLLSNVGSIHNLSLSRLATINRILFVEGHTDIDLLKAFQNCIDSNSSVPIDIIPHGFIEGWTGWSSALNTAKFFHKNVNPPIEIFVLLDRDYHLDEEIEKRKNEAKENNVYLHIWHRKEIENYVLVSGAIAKQINKEAEFNVSEEEVNDFLIDLVESEKPRIVDAFAEELAKTSRGVGPSNVNPKARKLVEKRWSKNNGLDLISGKKLLSCLSKWSQDNYYVMLSSKKIISSMNASEVDDELKELILKITAQ